MRITPLVSSMLYAARRASAVETSALGEFAPSLGRKSGSRPLVALKRARTAAGVMVHPTCRSWHVAQVRPFVPRDWKNGLVVSIEPLVVKVWNVPLASGMGCRFGSFPAAAL